MGMRIHQLPPLIANQIAAGEVIERPASVVKELLENSLDAGADAITIEIGYGGLNQIKISDNGVGIVAEDLPLAIAAHATSKINTLDDLYAIESMGFRGEALASIASVAKVTISSKPAAQDTAMALRVQGTDVTITPCARSQGTTIDVVDLFFNAPVRKRFLKGEKLEFQAIEIVVKRFALSAPGIALILKHNGKQVLTLPAATNEQTRLTRMTRIMGSTFMKNAIYLDVERGAMRLYGWISGTGFQRSQNDRQWVYINQRMVKDKLITHAIKQAYDDLLYPGRFPACVLYFSIDHIEVDVNVHPTKHEVRFQQPRLVHDFFTSQLAAALQSARVEPEAEKNYKPSYTISAPLAKEICEPYPQLDLLSRERTRVETDVSWIILNNQYILSFVQHKPYLINLFALHQHAVQERLAQQTLPWASRPLLVPIRYVLEPERALKMVDLNHSLEQLGIRCELSATHEVLVRTIPISVPYLDLRLFLDAVVSLDGWNLEQLIELMCQSQVFDPRLLSREEKIELDRIFVKLHGGKDKKAGLFKALTIEHCQSLLHV
ncbi:DNA mismatch repair endonuclease MutL [Legionella saoudiensis]|uniref:DNA mismatch repair endonuclease MutL n=1 Tax=Legionella saoudiensis TaxID=1750561 RepID=UPI0007300211|nr:DNA mismatch repair endonuclease MutL [Legionella saoudiensis]